MNNKIDSGTLNSQPSSICRPQENKFYKSIPSLQKNLNRYWPSTFPKPKKALPHFNKEPFSIINPFVPMGLSNKHLTMAESWLRRSSWAANNKICWNILMLRWFGWPKEARCLSLGGLPYFWPILYGKHIG